MSDLERCIFCWSDQSLTHDHVISAKVRKLLIGVESGTEIDWDEGSSELWAGGSTAERLDELTIRAVCENCNNRWMQSLDSEFARIIDRWVNNPDHKLGKTQMQVVERYLLKMLYLIRVGEDWSMGAWIRGEKREPEFIFPSIVRDGKSIHTPTSRMQLVLDATRYVGAARVSDQTLALIHIPPITADGIRPTQKVRRVNAGLILTFRQAQLRLWVVASHLVGQWAIRWPAGVTE